jgi:hypothetical protein
MDEKQKKDDMPDAGLAKESRPVPSQAEGDEETIDEDLREKEKQPGRRVA